jgi:hypothetical protein
MNIAFSGEKIMEYVTKDKITKMTNTDLLQLAQDVIDELNNRKEKILNRENILYLSQLTNDMLNFVESTNDFISDVSIQDFEDSEIESDLEERLRLM